MRAALEAYRAAPRPLAELVAGWAAVPPDLMVSDVTLDSRAAIPGSLFLAARRRAPPGLTFAPEAVARGASAVLYEPGDGAGDLGLPAKVFAAPVPELSARAGL